MNPYSPQAEKVMRHVARRDGMPLDLTSRIMCAVKETGPARRPLSLPRHRLAWCSALAASLLLAAGLWWGMPAAPPVPPAPAHASVPASAFSDLNPAYLVTAAPVTTEMQQLKADLARALNYMLAQPHPPS